MIVSGPMDGLFGMDEDDDDEEDDDDAADGAEGGGAATAESVALSLRHFDLLPKEVVAHLDRFVIKQQEAKVLSVATCDHYNHVRRCLADPAVATQDYSKPNILLVGPTGVGKTYLMRNIARLIGVPFVTADATKFSETGVVEKTPRTSCASSSTARAATRRSRATGSSTSTRSTRSATRAARARRAGRASAAGGTRAACRTTSSSCSRMPRCRCSRQCRWAR